MFLQYFLEFNRYLNIAGIAAILGIAFLASRNRSKINFKLVINALILQFGIAMLVLNVGAGRYVLEVISHYVNKIYLFADYGVRFLFGGLADASGPWGFIFAVKILPIIIFFGALMSLLFHWGIIQFVISLINRVVRRVLGTSGAESLCAISNSFLGQTEAPLLIRNYLLDMTKSEMFVVMVSGMATISGSILVVFSAMGVPAKHMLAASVMAIPASILLAKIIYPETEKPKTLGGKEVVLERKSSNVFDAISAGTSDGLGLALNVGAMLIAFISLLALFNAGLSGICVKFNDLLAYLGTSWHIPVLNIEEVLAYLFSPFGYLFGFEGREIFAAGHLLGKKVAMNELLAYGDMIHMGLSERTKDIMTYALCGFANFSSIGIQIGGIGTLVPERRKWLTELGLRAVLASTLANIMSAMIASLLL